MDGNASETAHLARNLASNCNYSVFPCLENKTPACRHGFKDGSRDPVEIDKLWRAHPGPLIGIATGAASGVDVLDIDPKHETAPAWWRVAANRIPPTRIYRTRGGGIHVYFQHAEGVRNTESKLAKGVDTRGDGGYAVFWFAAGLPCDDPTPPAVWPAWLVECVIWKPPPVTEVARGRRSDHADKAIEGILRLVSAAREGDRNRVLFWGACRLRERWHGSQIGQVEATALLTAAARAAGLANIEAQRTIASAWKAA